MGQAYLNGQFVPASEAAVSVADAGFVQGTAVAEQLRTFGGKLFRLEAHIERLMRSLAVVQVDCRMTREELCDAAEQLLAHNHPLLESGDDLGLVMFVTPGMYAAMDAHAAGQPTICMHTFPLRFGLWADKYTAGESLVTTGVTQVSPGCWPRGLKCRSRMHYYLADLAARRRDPGSRALMLDDDGTITETTTANIVLYSEGTGLIMPRHEKILPGISLATLLQIADSRGIAHAERDLVPDDVAHADEVFLTATSNCILPVVRFNGQPIGNGSPGPVYGKFLAAWSDLVGIDIAAQAIRFRDRDPRIN